MQRTMYIDVSKNPFIQSTAATQKTIKTVNTTDINKILKAQYCTLYCTLEYSCLLAHNSLDFMLSKHSLRSLALQLMARDPSRNVPSCLIPEHGNPAEYKGKSRFLTMNPVSRRESDAIRKNGIRVV